MKSSKQKELNRRATKEARLKKKNKEQHLADIKLRNARIAEISAVLMKLRWLLHNLDAVDINSSSSLNIGLYYRTVNDYLRPR